MRCAVVDLATSTVLNVIVADPEQDTPPEGCVLLSVAEGEMVDIGWPVIDGVIANPNPPIE